MKLQRVIVVVSGGRVEAVYTSSPTTRVYVLDTDVDPHEVVPEPSSGDLEDFEVHYEQELSF